MHQWLWKERDLVFARIYAFGSQRVNDVLDAWYSPNPSDDAWDRLLAAMNEELGETEPKSLATDPKGEPKA